jgi:hypothetical protein
MSELYEKLTEGNHELRDREVELLKIYATRVIKLAEESIRFKR